MTAWRLLSLRTYDAFMNMAIDEAVLRARIENVVPNTLRLYRWKRSAVSVGRFQDVRKEALLENCRKHGVDVVRRVTGGGAVYHDSEDEVTYCLAARKADLDAEDVGEVYDRIYEGLAEAVRILGVRADFNPGNAKTCPNLTINGRKISGSAQAHKRGVVLQHGTLLLRVDLDRMFTFLSVPWAKTRLQVVKAAKDKITSVSDEVGRNVSVSEVSDALISGFEKTLGVNLERGRLTAWETDLAQTLCREKYDTEKWNFDASS